MSEHRPDDYVREDDHLRSGKESAGARLSKIIAEFLNAVLDQVPIGYEDRNGFHVVSKLKVN